MSPRSKKEYIEAIFLRYKKASRRERTLILDEFCATCLYHRNIILKPLKTIWLKANLPCSRRLKVILPLWLPGYVQSFGPLSSKTSEALLKISAATIDRLLLPTRIKYKKRSRTTTKPGTLIRKHIPIKTNQW